MAAEGWGVVRKGMLRVRTVSDTRRAAIVNWLVTDAHVMVYERHTDDDVERLWNQYRQDATVERVKLTVMKSGKK